MPRLGKHAIDDIRKRMLGLTGADAYRTASELADTYGCSHKTVYRLSAEVRPSRRRRADAGNRGISNEAFGAFVAHTMKGLSVRSAREIMIDEGWDLPSESTLAARLREHRISSREREADLTPSVRIEASRPNRVWQVDASGSTMFYQDADGSVVYVNPIRHTKNKPQPDKPRVWIVSVVDDFSRCLWAELVPANDTQSWLRVIGNAAREKDSEFPFCGLPETLYTDNDAVVKSARFQRIIGMFDPPVEHVMHLPYHSRATGKVERLFRSIKHDFEARHRALHVPGLEGTVDQSHHEPTRWASLDEANAALRDWVVAYNNRQHGTTKQAPFQRWVQGVSRMASEGHEVRAIDDTTLNGIMLVDETDRRVNRDLTISLNNTRYALPHQEPFLSLIDKKLRVWWSPEIPGSIWADVSGQSFEMHPVGQPIEFGQFRAIPMTKRDELRRTVARAADPAPPEQSQAGERAFLPAAHAGSGEAGTRATSPDAKPQGTPYVHRKPARAVMPDAPIPSVVMKTRTQALTWLRTEKVFHSPVADWEIRAFDAFLAGRDDVEFAELRRWAIQHRSAGARQSVGAAS